MPIGPKDIQATPSKFQPASFEQDFDLVYGIGLFGNILKDELAGRRTAGDEVSSDIVTVAHWPGEDPFDPHLTKPSAQQAHEVRSAVNQALRVKDANQFGPAEIS
jgi:hypothetical protein